MAVNTQETLLRPKPIPLFTFGPESSRDTYGEEASEKVFNYWKQAQEEVDPSHFRLPRLVVRDHMGRKIDIYTSYQDKIYAAKKAVRETGEARNPEEWRLPHAPLPARPDLTRTARPSFKKRVSLPLPAEELPSFRQQPFTVDVEDVSFIAESLRCLPDVASLSYLRHEFLAGNKLFMPILKAAMLHQRLLSVLDRRVAQYQSPAECAGCIRSGLCYGCDKGTQPHYHMDKMAKTGGGFTYYKRDRPGNLMERQDPRNWRTRFQEEFDKLAKEIAEGGEYEVHDQGFSTNTVSLIPDFSKQYPLQTEQHGGKVQEQSANISTVGESTKPKTSDTGSLLDLKPGCLPLVPTNLTRFDSGLEENYVSADISTVGESTKPKTSDTGSLLDLKPGCLPLVPTNLTRFDSGLEENYVSADISEPETYRQESDPSSMGPGIYGYRYQGWASDDDDEELTNKPNTTETDYKENELFDPGQLNFDMNRNGLEGLKMSVPGKRTAGQRTLNGLDVPNLDDDKSSTAGKQERRQKRLYKAPPPFKLKPRQKKDVTGRSPFSTDRDLNLPKGNQFTVKKSEKKLTEFKEFTKSGTNWKEPKKFELKETNKKQTNFWSPPKKSEENKNVQRKKPPVKRPPVVEDPVLSSDSGLDSEQFQAWIQQILNASEQECEIEAEFGQLFEYPTRWLQAVHSHGYWPPVMPQAEQLFQGSVHITGDSNGTDYEYDGVQYSPDSYESVFERLVDQTDFHPSERGSGSRKSSLQSYQTDTTYSIGAPPIYESSRVSLTSPELTLSLADIGEKVLPLTFDDPIELTDALMLKKLRRRRKKKSKKSDGDDILANQVDVEDGELKIINDTENAENNFPQVLREPHDFSPFLRSSKKHQSSLSRKSSTVEINPPQHIEYQTLKPEENDCVFTDDNVPSLLRVDSEEKSSGDTLEDSRFNSVSTPGQSKDSSNGRKTSHSQKGIFKNKGPATESRSSKKAESKGKTTSTKSKRVIKSPERVFSGLDDELMKKLPSIQAQLQKLGVNIDHLKPNQRSNCNLGNDHASEKDTLRVPSASGDCLSRPSSQSSFLTISGRPTSARSRMFEDQTSPPVLSRESSKLLPMLMHENEPSVEICNLCGASLEHVALHICLPPLASRMKPKKTKALFPKRVAHTRQSQKRILVKEVTYDSTPNGKELLEKGDDSNNQNLLTETESPLTQVGNGPDHRVEEETKGDSVSGGTPPVEPPAKPKRERLQRKQKKAVTKTHKQEPEELPQIKPPSPAFDEDVTPTSSLTPPTPRNELTPLPPITSFEVPELPDFVFPDQPKPRTPRQKKMIAAPLPPPVKETKKIRKPPPKPRKQIRIKHAKRSVAEAPVTTAELQQATDPLDFLAKYCIIHVERLPLYEHVFKKAVSEQTPKYPLDGSLPGTAREAESLIGTTQDPSLQSNGSDTSRSWNPQFSSHEMKMIHDLTVINRSSDMFTAGASHAEAYLEKLKFSFEVLHEKQKQLQKQVKELQERRVTVMAEKAKELFPEILIPGGRKSSKKKNKKSGKKSALSAQSKDVIFSESSSPVEGKSPRKSVSSIHPQQLTDTVIVEGLTSKQYDSITSTAEATRVEVELERAEEKLNNVFGRLEDLKGETALIQMYCMEYFFQSEIEMARPRDFMRQQSTLYNSLHPTPDLEINMSDVGVALQSINNNLLTEKEMEYLFHILNLAGRPRINFQLFSVLAALSERVAQLDPLIKKLINKLDYEALDVKMEKCKELFALLHDGDYLPGDHASASILAVELTAGGLTPEHTAYVLSKFNRGGSGIIDFMDFVTYVPLFIQIHQRIVDDPLRADLDI